MNWMFNYSADQLNLLKIKNRQKSNGKENRTNDRKIDLNENITCKSNSKKIVHFPRSGSDAWIWSAHLSLSSDRDTIPRHFSRSIINLKTFGHVSSAVFLLLPRLILPPIFHQFRVHCTVCSIADNLLDIYSNCFAKKAMQPNTNEIFIECNECTANIKSGNSIFTRARVLRCCFSRVALFSFV